MTTLQGAILTAIHFKGLAVVKSQATKLADDFLCSAGYIRSICKKVEKGQIIIKSSF